MAHRVFRASLFLILLGLWLNKIKAQEVAFGRAPILILKTGSTECPIKITKEWFEDETMYTLTFRDANFKSFKTTQQGFLKPELKSLGSALQRSLTIDSTLAIKFDKGIITATTIAGKKQVEWVFSSRSVIFRANVSDVKKIINTIAKE